MCAPPASCSCKEGVETVAISFVWSVLNPAHERRAAEIVREMMPDAILTVGSELYPQIREYTRTSTAVMNAYLAPVMRRYVEAVDAYFRSLGAQAAGALFPVQRRSRHRPGDDRPLGLCHQLRPGLRAAGRALCLRAVQEEERHHRRHGRHLLRHHADQGRPDQPQQEHRLPALPHRRADDPGGNAGCRRRLDRLDRLAGHPAGRPAIGGLRPGPGLLWPGRHGADDVGRQSGARLSQSRRPARRQAAARSRQGAQGA